MALTKIDDRGVTYPLDLLDNEKIRFGTGNDLSLYHDSTDTWIKNDTGDLMIQCDGDDLVFRSKDDIHMWVQGASGSGHERAIFAAGNGAVELHYDGSGAPKLTTTSDGVQVDGQLKAYSTGNAHIVAERDSGASGYIQAQAAKLVFGSTTNHDVQFITNSNGRLTLTAGGNVQIPNDSGQLQLGASQDLQIFHNGTDSVIYNATGDLDLRSNGTISLQASDGTEIYGNFVRNAEVSLYYDNSKKLETSSSGVTVTGDVALASSNSVTAGSFVSTNTSTAFTAVDGAVGYFGSGLDLRLYHDGSHSYVKNTTGILHLQSDGSGVRIQKTDGERMIYAIPDGAVELYHNDVKMFETTNDGALITGYGSGINLPNATLKIRTSNGGEPVDDKTMLVLQNGIDSGDLDQEDSHIDFVFKDSNDNRTPQTRISAHVGSGGSASSVAKEGRGYLTFHCSNTSTEDNNEWNPSERFRIAANGDLTATDTSISSNSDSRLKKDVTDYSYSLSTFKQFKPKTFNWINPIEHNDKNQRGFVAQEVKAIDSYLTGAITLLRDSSDLSLVDSDRIAHTTKLGETDAMYISVIQQLLSKVETLETKVAALEAK